MRTNPCIKTNTEEELEEQQSTQFINSYAVVHVAYIMQFGLKAYPILMPRVYQAYVLAVDVDDNATASVAQGRIKKVQSTVLWLLELT